MSIPVETTHLQAIRLCLRGQIQGRGVRPAIARHAARCGITGEVKNTRDGLEIVAEGQAANLRKFCARLRAVLPVGCQLEAIDKEPVAAADRTGFEILRDGPDGPLSTPVPRDIGVCPECLKEVGDASNRRSKYALTSCAACGPRYTIVRNMPYERAETAMADFPLCDDCEQEYLSPRDRRFHAQTTACGACGPRIWMIDDAGNISGRDSRAIEICVAALREGKIVALRGIGGYQLLCDATSDDAVRRLRDRKRRPGKPLAVLVPSVSHARQLAFLSDQEQTVLVDATNPIVLLRAKTETSLSREIRPGLDTVGLMLPTTPLHALVARTFGAPLVCTSANREGDPLEYDAYSSQQALAGIADLWLHHDRPIERPIDDSVVRVIAGGSATLRLARGLAPLPLELPGEETLLALGGHQKVAAAWSNGRQAVLGPHVGDMGTVPSRDRFVDQCMDWERLYGFAPSLVVHDLHADYFTTTIAAESGVPTLAVQHHFAHVAAGMLEHGLLDESVLGVAWDGTGYGTDGTIWGGEFLIVDQARRFERVAHLRPFPLAGGEAAIREPIRVTIALLREAIGEDALLDGPPMGIDDRRLKQILELLRRPRLTVRSTSAGRLFDAVAALMLPIDTIDFDGQPAMLLESMADRSASGEYSLPLIAGNPMQLDWRPLFADVWNDYRRAASPGAISMRFHRALAGGIAAVIRRHPHLPVVLTGGVFQNRLLTELVVELLNDHVNLKLPGMIPVNDGGLAAGQLAVAVQSRRDCRGDGMIGKL